MTYPKTLYPQLGIPTRDSRIHPGFRLALIAVAIMIAAGVIGSALGTVDVGGRLSKFREAFGEFLAETDPDRLADQLKRLEEQRAMLARQGEARIMMFMVYTHAASHLPWQKIHYEAALRELRAGLELVPLEQFPPLVRYQIYESESHLLMELGRWAEAKAALDAYAALLAKDKNPQMQVNLDNGLAYLLAIADDPEVQAPEAALNLAKGVIRSEVKLSGDRYATGVAAYVDTLAEAYFVNGDFPNAHQSQRTALALARSGLSVYLEHYDRNRSALKK